MKAKIIRDDIECSPQHMPPGHEEQYEYREVLRNGGMMRVPFWKLNAILDMPDVWMLVQQGCAVPEDDGCRLRANRTPQQMAAAQHAYSKVAMGIHPDDYELFDAGAILGYLPNGDYKPGPNFHLVGNHTGEQEDDE